MSIPAPAFFTGLVALASRIGCPALDLLQVMYAESSCNPAAENQASGASGLIQVMPFNLAGVGFHGTPAQFRQLSAEAQLPYVERYFEPWRRYGLTNVNRVYQAVFLPGTLPLGSDDSTAIAIKGGALNNAYMANASVDVAGKGFITVGDLRAAVEARCTGQRWRECVEALNAAQIITGSITEVKAMIAPDRTSSSPFSNPFPPSDMGVVIHATRSGTSMNPTELEGTLNWFQNPAARVSSHWVIGRKGEKVRVIPDDRQAWHAGWHNATHWGIEVEQGVESDGFTPEQMTALVAVCKGYVEMGVPAVHDFNGFVGHSETPQGRASGKSDPGSRFDWDWFINALYQDEAAPAIAGIGAHYADGSDEEIWQPQPGKVLDGVGARYTDGTITRLWP